MMKEATPYISVKNFYKNYLVLGWIESNKPN